MNRQQIDQFLLSFKNNLQYKIIKIFVIIILTFFAILTLFKLAIIQKNISIRNQSEFTYLQRVGRKMMISEETRLNCVLLFLETTRKLAQADNLTQNTEKNCDNTIFGCNNSGQNTNYSTAKALASILQINSNILIQNDEVQCIFTFVNKKAEQSKVYFNSVCVGIDNCKKLNHSIVDHFISQNSNYYSDSSKQNNFLFGQAVNQFNSLFVFICSHLTIANQSQVLCVLLIRNISNSISLTKNNQYFRASTFDSISTGVTGMSISQWIKSSEFYLQTPLVIDCINSRIANRGMGMYLDIFEGQPQICRHRHYFFFDIFGPFFTYADFKLKISRSIASDMYSSVSESQQLSIEYFISANNSYRSDINFIISTNIKQLRYMGYTLILILGFSLLLIKYPDELVQNDIVNSLLQIHKLYDHLRNKDEKEFINIYNKRKTSVFAFIPEYLNKYMWVYKLIKANKEKAKYKNILKEGIELFGNEDYSVKRFIYKELIRLEKKLIDSLLKVRQLPLKKKVTCKLEFQLPQTNIMQNHDKFNNNKRRNANIQLLNPDDDQFMKNISLSFKPNRGVRFSNDIQTVEIDQGPVLRKSKMADSQARSCETIKNDLSEPDFESLKHNENNKDSVKSLKDDEESYTSLNELSRSRKKDSSLRSRGLESIYADIQNMRLDEQQSEMKEIPQEENEEQKEMFAMSRQSNSFALEISNIYHKTMKYYEDLIKLKTNQAKKQREDQLLSSVNTIYKLTLQKYQLLGKMLRFQNQKGLKINQELRDQISKFKDICYLEQNYMALINYELLQQGEVVKLQINQELYLPVSFKNLEFLARSSQRSVRIVARRMLAQMCEKLTPHLDSILMKNICSLLQQEETDCSQKRNLLLLLARTLQRYYGDFTEDISDLKLASQFYNKNNKKIYFIVSILNPKPCSKLIERLYEYIQPFDMLVIFNLQEQSCQPEPEVSETFISKLKTKKNCIQRVKFELNEQDFSELFSYVPDRLKEVQEKNGSTSSKTIARKKMYEKEFHEILNSIEADQTEFSKYLFVLLGQQNYTYAGETQDTSSSGNHRPEQQKIHQEITKTLDKGYYHIVLAGHQLSQYPSKYGKLKKYLKLSPQLLQIQLSDKEQEQNYKTLQKYLK